MRIKFIPPADQELIDAFDYYEAQLTGLGKQFKDEFNKTVKILLISISEKHQKLKSPKYPQ